jgi:predicted metal-binding membrane protein
MTLTQAMRSRMAVVALTLAAAGAAWWSTAERMAGMAAGPGADLGSLGWFTGAWAVMMAAMMLPSLAPTAALYAALTRDRKPSRWLLFAGGYLLVWSAAGLLAYGLFEPAKQLLAGDLTWHSGGRWLAAGVLAIAAVYELTPLKQACLRRCRSPQQFLPTAWHDGWLAAIATGVRTGGWCLGCSWALMAALFALGVMSLSWMALVAALVAVEKLGPWPRSAVAATAAVLLVLAVVR